MEGKFVSKEEDFMHVILSCTDKYSLEKGNGLFRTGLFMVTQARVLTPLTKTSQSRTTSKE